MTLLANITKIGNTGQITKTSTDTASNSSGTSEFGNDQISYWGGGGGWRGGGGGWRGGGWDGGWRGGGGGWRGGGWRGGGWRGGSW